MRQDKRNNNHSRDAHTGEEFIEVLGFEGTSCCLPLIEHATYEDESSKACISF
jgi:hypothetical protein